MTLRPLNRKFRASLGAALVGIALVATAGCSAQKDLDALPGLADVTPTGPAGKKCFDFCAQAKVDCDHMCPQSVGVCQDDCIADSKHCLVDCPELQRPAPPPKK